jgi:cell division protein FtsB
MKPKKKMSELEQLKADNRALAKENANLKKHLAIVITAWRDQDMRSAEKCFDVCRKSVEALVGKKDTKFLPDKREA